jgi:hypothetical protein
MSWQGWVISVRNINFRLCLRHPEDRTGTIVAVQLAVHTYYMGRDKEQKQESGNFAQVHNTEKTVHS